MPYSCPALSDPGGRRRTISTRHHNPAWADKQSFSTGEAAEICNVSQQTIIRCFDSGRLRGYRVPGSRFRRIPRAELIRFMKHNGMPAHLLENPARRVLIVADDDGTVSGWRDDLTRDGRFEVSTAACGYEAGVLTERFKPHVILLDDRVKDLTGDLVGRRVRSNPHLRETKVLVVTGATATNGSRGQRRIDACLRRPVEGPRLVAELETLLEIGPESGSPGNA